MDNRSRDLNDIDLIVVHCADTPNGYGRYTIDDIDEWHKDKGFKRGSKHLMTTSYQHVGYHYVIHVDGKVCQGRTLREKGQHAKNYNENSVGVCMVGKHAFTKMQWKSLTKTIKKIKEILPRKDVRVLGHKDLSTKSCPGFDVYTWLHERKGKPEEKHICEER